MSNGDCNAPIHMPLWLGACLTGAPAFMEVVEWVKIEFRVIRKAASRVQSATQDRCSHYDEVELFIRIVTTEDNLPGNLPRAAASGITLYIQLYSPRMIAEACKNNKIITTNTKWSEVKTEVGYSSIDVNIPSERLRMFENVQYIYYSLHHRDYSSS